MNNDELIPVDSSFNHKRKSIIYKTHKVVKKKKHLKRGPVVISGLTSNSDPLIEELISSRKDSSDIESEKDEADQLYDSIFKEENKTRGVQKKRTDVDEMLSKLKSTTTQVPTDDSILVAEAEEDQDAIDFQKIDDVLSEKAKKKYSTKNFQPTVYTKKELLSKMKQYYFIIPKILSGEIESYFYCLGSDLMKKSKNDTMQGWEFRNLPLHLLQCGYIGKKRSMIVKQKIFLKFNSLLVNAMKKNKVVKYFGVDNFITYILLPEVVSYFIKAEFKLSDIDKAIDLMELTNDYGLYIMDKIDTKDEEYNSDEEDDKDMLLTKKEMHIIEEPDTPVRTAEKNFVKELIGFSEDEDSD